MHSFIGNVYPCEVIKNSSWCEQRMKNKSYKQQPDEESEWSKNKPRMDTVANNNDTQSKEPDKIIFNVLYEEDGGKNDYECNEFCPWIQAKN